MAIITPSLYSQATNQTFTTGALTQLASICTSVDIAIRHYIRPFEPEPVTRTVIRDAPPLNVLRLGIYPIRSITSLYLKWDANGDTTAFTSDDLLTEFTDYYLELDRWDDQGTAYNSNGCVYRRGGSVWAAEYRRPIGRLASTIEPCRGAIKATLVCGPTAVPEDLKLAAELATSFILKRINFGAPFTSESWNSYSYSLPGPFLVAALASPDVAQILMKYAMTGVAAG